MSQIKVSHLSFAYEGSCDTIFNDVSFSIDTQWKLGFIGRNGRGKTTFFRLLLGRHEYGGSISHSVAFDYFPFAVENASLATGLLLGELRPECAQWQLLRELSLLQVEESVLERPFATLSPGEQTKVLLAALFLREERFLLIDEPTNHLDEAGRALVAGYLRRKQGFILVSHDRRFLDGCIDHVLAINKADIQVERGNFSTWWENKQRRDQFELERQERLKREIKRLEQTAREKEQWSRQVEKSKFGCRNSGIKPSKGYVGHKAAKMMQQAKNLQNRQEQAIEEKSGLLQNLERNESIKLVDLTYHSPTLAWLRGVDIVYDGHSVCRDVSFTIERGDRIALRGKNGCGKSSLVKLLLGWDIPHRGQCRCGGGLVVSYVPQHSEGLQGNLKELARQNGLDETLFKSILRKLDFSREQFDKDMADFSAGQKKKVRLAQSLCQQAHLYIWDEPLNYIDLLSRLQIEELLLRFKPTLLFIEHDGEFCRNIATKEVCL